MDDLISRQEAIDALKEEEYPCESDYDEGYMEALDKAVWFLEKWLPSAERKGEWLETEFLKLRECSCCHVRWGMYDVENFNYCPNCGADMRGEQE